MEVWDSEMEAGSVAVSVGGLRYLTLSVLKEGLVNCTAFPLIHPRLRLNPSFQVNKDLGLFGGLWQSWF